MLGDNGALIEKPQEGFSEVDQPDIAEDVISERGIPGIGIYSNAIGSLDGVPPNLKVIPAPPAIRPSERNSRP